MGSNLWEKESKGHIMVFILYQRVSKVKTVSSSIIPKISMTHMEIYDFFFSVCCITLFHEFLPPNGYMMDNNNCVKRIDISVSSYKYKGYYAECKLIS